MRPRLVAALLALTACSPEQAIEVMFAPHGPGVVEQAKQVAFCESRMDPTAVSSGGHLGLFQMSPRWHSHRPGMHSPLEALFNAQAAESLYREQGWRPWSCRP